MIGIAYLKNGVAEDTRLLIKETDLDESVHYRVDSFRFGIVKDSRKETRGDYSPSGFYVVKLLRFAQRGFPILEILVKIENPRLFEIYTAGLPWKYLNALAKIQEMTNFVPGGNTTRWMLAWRIFKEAPLSEEEKPKALKLLDDYYADGFIDEEDWTYYTNYVQSSPSENTVEVSVSIDDASFEEAEE